MSFQSLGPHAPVTTLLLGINVVLFVFAGIQSKDMGSFNGDVLIMLGASRRELLWEGDWLRLIAPNFLHGGLLHIFFNTSALMAYGPVQERLFGSSNFASLYLLSGVSGFCFSQVFGGTLSIGASGALFGLLGAEIAVLVLELPVWKYAWRNGEIRQRVLVLGFLMGLGVLGNLLGSGLGNWDNWCHLGGALAGFAFGSLFELWRRRGRLSLGLIILPLAGVMLLIAAARWSVFNPYYHVHQGALALTEKREAEAERHFVQAQQWAATWGIQRRVARIEAGYRDGSLTLDDARFKGYRYILVR